MGDTITSMAAATHAHANAPKSIGGVNFPDSKPPREIKEFVLDPAYGAGIARALGMELPAHV